MSSLGHFETVSRAPRTAVSILPTMGQKMPFSSQIWPDADIENFVSIGKHQSTGMGQVQKKGLIQPNKKFRLLM